MNYKKILISEQEKNTILGLHNSTKKTPTTSLINEVLTINDFPICVRTIGPLRNDKGGNQFIFVKDGGGKGRSYYYYSNQVMKVEVEGKEGLEGGYYYYCQCVSGKCNAKITKTMVQHECSTQKPCKQGDTQKGITGDQIGGRDCKSKNPMQVVTELGLNWKETRQKWIDAKCNGTTPCILGDATTNINLRNALCKGTWDPKTGGSQGTTPRTEQKPGDQGTIPGNQQGDDKKYSEEYIAPTFGQTPKAD